MTNEPRIASYRQSRDFTCGAAALAVALHELGCGDLSEQEELRIWRYAHVPWYGGSLPARLARFAQERGCDARLLVCRARVRELCRAAPLRWRLVYRYVLAHERLAELQTPPVMLNTLADVSQWLDGRPRGRILALVQEDGYELHYVLARRHDGGLLVLDPAHGSNVRVAPDNLTFGSSPAGYFVLIDRPDVPAAPPPG